MLRFWAYRARREGKPIPRWQLHTLGWNEGCLTLREERDEWLGRTVRIARLTDGRGHEVFPALIEAQLIQADDDSLVLNGLERDDLTRCDRAQTWVLHTANQRGRGSKGEPETGETPPHEKAPRS